MFEKFVELESLRFSEFLFEIESNRKLSKSLQNYFEDTGRSKFNSIIQNTHPNAFVFLLRLLL